MLKSTTNINTKNEINKKKVKNTNKNVKYKHMLTIYDFFV